MINRVKNLLLLLGNVVQFVCIPLVWWISTMEQMLSGRGRTPDNYKAMTNEHSGRTCTAPSVVSHQDIIAGTVSCECGAVHKVIAGCSDSAPMRNAYSDEKAIVANCHTKVFMRLDDVSEGGKPA